MTTDLLARIHSELERRMAELRPLLDEYERLLAAAATLDAMDTESTALDGANDGAESTAPSAVVDSAAPATVVPPIEYEYEYDTDTDTDTEHKPAAPSDVKQAILAALEHGSHTVSELVMVSAMSPSEIRTNLSRLARQRKVTRVKRQGDGKSAYALPASAAHS
jgi:DNA-binding transcriptional ArsR family regulator